MLGEWQHPEAKPSKTNWSDYKTYDLIGHIDDCAKARNPKGNYCAMAAWFLAAYLTLWEISRFQWVKTEEKYTVDHMIGDRYKFGLNITFHALPCDEVEVNCLDYTGEPHLHLTDGIKKLQMRDGKVVNRKDLLPLPEGDDVCLSCFAAGDEVKPEDETPEPTKEQLAKRNQDGPDGEEHKKAGHVGVKTINGDKKRCCNTCHQLRDAYAIAGLEPRDAKNQPQCKNVGCRLEGSAEIIKVAGDVRITAGTMIHEAGKFYHDVDTDDLVYYGFNISHTIHSIRFGHDHGLEEVSMPLDGHLALQDKRFTSFVYDVEFVPTEYVGLTGGTKHTHQYTEKHYNTTLDVINGQPEGVPGLYLLYNFSPLMLRSEQVVDSFSRLFITLAIHLGGVFGLFSLLDRLSGKLMKRGPKSL